MITPPPLSAPAIPPYQAPPPFGYVPPVPGAFTGQAPTAKPLAPLSAQAPAAQPYGAFTGQAPTATAMPGFVAPDPANTAASQPYQFRLSQGLQAIERGAAQRGTLLTGGLQTRLNDYAGDAASQEYDKDWRRALDAYTTNRDTVGQNFNLARGTFQDTVTGYTTNRDTAAQNVGQERAGYQDAVTGYKVNADTAAQNFAQDRASFSDVLAGSKANADTTLAAGAQGLAAATAGYDRNAASGRMVYEDAAADALRKAGVTNANSANTYQAMMLDYQRQQDESRRQADQVLQETERLRREQLYQEQLQREGSARQNAATNAIPPSPYLPEAYFGPLPRRRQAGVSAV